jgi:hypothetical protein
MDGLGDFVGAVDDCHDHECCTGHKMHIRLTV